MLEPGQGTGLVSCVLRNPPRWRSISQFLAEYLHMYDRKLIRSHFHLKLSADTPEKKQEDDIVSRMMGMSMPDLSGYPLLPYFRWEHIPSQPMPFEQLMPKPQLLHWLHAHFLKLCLPYPRPPADYTLVYAPLNLTIFLRLVVHVAELGYPAHWLSALLTALLEGEITSTARAPRRLVLLRKDVDEVHAPRKICVAPWPLDLATLVGLWQHVLPFGLVAPARLVPRTRDIAEYTVAFAFPPGELAAPNVPHFMLVFWDEEKFGRAPRELRSGLLLDDETASGGEGDAAKRAGGVRVLNTFRWTRRESAATFWMEEAEFERMVVGNWRLYVWRTDVWERQSAAVELRGAVVRKRRWEEWAGAGAATR